MNANWFAWGATRRATRPNVRQVWRKVWNAFAAPTAPARPTPVVSSQRQGRQARRFRSVYPGNDYVQIVGLDGYNFYDFRSPAGTWRPCQDL
jgi:beta-mannanase